MSTCDQDTFKYFVNEVCIFEYEAVVTLIIAAGEILSVLFQLYLLFECQKKKRKLIELNPYVQYIETYNILSYNILLLVQLMLVFSVAPILIDLFQLMHMQNYVSDFISFTGPDCTLKYAWESNLKDIIFQFSNLCLISLYLMQQFEWESMIFVINS